MHRFDDQLAVEARYQDRWDAFWRRWRPGCTITRYAADDGGLTAQLKGIDLVLETDDGESWRVDEKVREQTRYTDCLVELWSQWYGPGDDRNRPGWTVDRDKTTTLVAYALPHVERVYLLAREPLRRIVQQRAKEWIRAKRVRPSRNETYQTINLWATWDEVHPALIDRLPW